MSSPIAKAALLITASIPIAFAQPIPSAPKFEVASVKAVPPGPSPEHAGIKLNSARVDIGSWSIRQLILRAYEIPSYRLDAPDWLNAVRFDVAAKMPEGEGKDEVPAMLRSLLADRFGLKAHTETRQMQGYALTIGKGGLKMKAGVPDPQAPHVLESLWGAAPFGLTKASQQDGKLQLEFSKAPMEGLAQLFASHLHVPVIDETRLKGVYAANVQIGDEDAIYDSAQRLGLKLEARKVSLQMLVLDHVERAPTEN